MSAEEEQALEIEGLQAIFEEGKELQQVSDTEFSLVLVPNPAGEAENHVGVTLHVVYTPEYPEVAPEWDIKDVKGLSDDNEAKLRAEVEEVVSSSIGMAMVYTMAEACQEFLRANNFKPLSMHEEMMLRLEGKTQQVDGGDAEEDEEEDEEEDDDEEGGQEEEEWKGLAEKQAVDEKDRITPEIFNAWKVKFEEEMVATGVIKVLDQTVKTGRQIFFETQAQAETPSKDGTAEKAQSGAVVYDATLFGEDMDDDLDDLSGGDD